MMIPSVSQNVMTKAEALSVLVPTLSKARDKQTGITYTIFPSSDDPEHTGHGSNGLYCSCRGWARNRVCSHSVAVTLARDRAQAELVRLAQRCRVDGCTAMSTTRSQRCDAHFQTLVDELGL